MTTPENIVIETVERIFADFADAQTILRSRDGGWKAPLWRALTGAGLPLSWVGEDYGGSGVSLQDGFQILQSAGRHGIAVPLVETMLAGWLLEQAGLNAPAGMMTVAPLSRISEAIGLGENATLTGVARRVPFASDADYIAIVAVSAGRISIASVRSADCAISSASNLASDDRCNVTLSGVRPLAIAQAPTSFNPDHLMMMGALARSLQIAGALETLLAMSVRYANDRVAFGKPIGKFQAIQHALAQLAGEVAAAVAAAGSAADAVATLRAFDGDAMLLEIASAKIRCAEAAEKAAAIAHQVHGAIGFTREHPLHRLTLRALAWRDDFGHESEWAQRLGARVAMSGADALWPLVASR